MSPIKDKSEIVTPQQKYLAMFKEIRDGGLRAAPQVVGQWESLQAIVDSGATVPVIPLATGLEYEAVEGEAMRNNVKYEIADGSRIPNMGEKLLPVVTQEGTLRGYSTQVADVSRPLQSVRHLYKTGHLTVFDGPDSFILNKVSGEVNQIMDDGTNYLMNMVIVPKSELNQVIEQASMQQQQASQGFHGQVQ